MINYFDGLKVVEFAGVLAGPRVGMFLAELGADVLKIEPPKGDVTRTWKLTSENQNNTISAYYCSVNWGKNVQILDLNNPIDCEKAQKLAEMASIVLVSYKPGDALKFGLDYESLAAKNPELIYGEITGYGSSCNRVGYDAIIQAETGFTFLNGPSENDCQKMPVALMDVLAAEQLKAGLLVAIIERLKTNFGKKVSVSLYQSGISALVNQATNFLVGRKVPKPTGSEHPNIVPYGTKFQTIDKQWVVLAIGTNHQFNRLVSVLGVSALATDLRCISNIARVENRAFVNTTLQSLIQKWHSNDLLTLLQEQQIPAGLILPLDKVFENDIAKDMVYQFDGLAGVSTIAFQENRENLKPPQSLGGQNCSLDH